MTKIKIIKKATQLMIMASGVMVACLLIVGFISVRDMRFNTVGKMQKQDAELFSDFIVQQIENEIKNIRSHAADLWWHDRIKEANLRYVNWEPKIIKDYMARRDEQWINTKDSKLVQEILSSRLSQELKEQVGRNVVIEEIFFTDKYGGLVAASGKTSDYYQADESWWQNANKSGTDDVFFGEVELESGGKIRNAIAILIHDETGQVIGISKAILNITVFLKPLMQYKFGKTGRVAILDEHGNVIYHFGLEPMTNSGLSGIELDRLLRNKNGFMVIKDSYSKVMSLAAAAKIKSPSFKASGINWLVVVTQDLAEVSLPLYMIFGIKLIIALIIFSVIMVFMRNIIKAVFIFPLEKIRQAALRLSAGELDYKINLKTGDEFEDLANVFDKMSEELNKFTVSRSSLLKEVENRKLAEQKALEAKQDWEDSFNSINDMITIHDVNFNVILANKAAESNLGIALRDILGQKCFKSYHGKECPPEECPSCKTLKTGVTFTSEIFEPHLNKFIEIKAMPRFDAKHNVIGLVHIVRDITERRQAQDKLNQALKKEIKSHEIMISMLDDNNQIRGKLEKSLMALQDTQAQLIYSEKMEAVGRMASSIAHEVKSPLGILLQGINYFERMLPAKTKDNLEVLQMMKDGIQRADNIVRALLDFSRTQELKVGLQDVNTIIKSSIVLVQHKLKLNSVECVLELAEVMPKVLVDVGRLEQVFINLFDNAADVMPGGGKLYIRSYLSELKTPGNRIGNRNNDFFRLKEEALIVEIEDTGAGIGKDVIAKIFDPFFTSKSRREGTGLGLSVAKSILESHQGLISVESQEGKGAKFTLIFKIPEKEIA